MRLMPQNQAGLRAVAAIALGCAFGAFVLVSATSSHPPHTDWDQIYTGARVFFGGGDPYTTVRHDHYPSYYPAYAYGPGFVYEPNYAYLLGRLQYDYVTSPERRYNPGFCRFWAC